MQLTTLVDILEREMPGLKDNPSTRNNLARLYAEQGRHADAVSELRAARRGLVKGAEAVVEDTRDRPSS